jgi:acetyl-CoA hydrolase
LLRDSSFTQFVTSARLTGGGDLAGGPLIAVNSAIEVDLRGQVNSEYAGDRYVGAVGGQADYLRAARQTPGGVGIIALASETADGRLGRIVSRISSGVVTTAQSDVDLVVTEYGVADLRAADLTERRRRLIAVAHPDRREDLAHKLGDSEEMK